MKKIIYLLSLISILSLSSCEDVQDFGNDETSVMVQIDAEALFSDANSRAVFTTDQEKNNVNRFCLLLYDGMNADSKLISAINIDNLPTTVNLPSPDAKQYRAVLLGNVQLSNLVDGSGNSCVIVSSSTFGDLETPSFAFRRTDNALIDRSATDFTWSDFQTFADGQKSLKFFLNPNVAKIVAKITNQTTSKTNTEAAITNVRVKNVAPKVKFAQCALYESELSGRTVENTDHTTMLKYDMEKIQIFPGTGKTVTVEWYVPHNWQGDGNRTATNNIPENATYIEVDGVKNGLNYDFVTASYKIYPGINEFDANGNKLAYTATKNFNICADHIYTVNIAITDDGISYSVNSEIGIDHVSETTKIKCFPQSNCWFIHPKLQKTNGVKVWELPIDRINEYWSSVNTNNTITAKSEWVMDVIWQDQNTRVIHFCDEYGNYSDATDNSYHGFGLNPAYITLDQTTLDNTYNGSLDSFPKKDIYGNILVGVRKPNESTYLWSWHLWVTDYCPDYAPTYNSGYGGIYNTGIDYQGYIRWNNSTDTWAKVYNGSVQHLRQADFKLLVNTYPSAWTTKYGAIWDTGIYKNKWMMDRMLGAQSPSNAYTQTHTEGWGLYYQYGRKDPFSLWGCDIQSTNANNLAIYQSTYKCYDITGTAKSKGWTVSSGKASSFSDGVMNPTICYSSSAGGSWLSTVPNSNPWYSPSATDKDGRSFSTTGRKTLFDPCPPGWCLPKWEAFYPFAINNGIYNQYSATTDATTYIFLGNDLSASANPYGEFRHSVAFDNDGLDTSDPVFPIQGYISPTGTKLRLPTENGDAGFGQECRGYMWAVNDVCGYGYGTSNPDPNYATVQIAFGTYNTVTKYSHDYLGYGFWGLTNRAFYYSRYSASRGQNVRCIQEPD